MRLIVHRQRPAAVAGERIYFAPHIEVLESDHPERRFVAALCLYSHAVDTGQAPPRYDQREAECFARCLLMPNEEFDPVACLPDAELSELFMAPIGHVRARRDRSPPSERRRSED
jgi:hypothetical protein